MKSKLIAAMEAAGYYFDEMKSTDDQLRFLGDYGAVMYMDSWNDTKQWLERIVFDDPAVSDRVEKILHLERFKNGRRSVLKRLEEKKQNVGRDDLKNVQNRRKSQVREKAENVLI